MRLFTNLVTSTSLNLGSGNTYRFGGFDFLILSSDSGSYSAVADQRAVHILVK
jgi:hypothetical protein